MNDELDDLSEQFADLLDKYNKKLLTPNWFKFNVKTLLNKNITIEDWNRAMLYIKNVSSEAEILLQMCELFANRDAIAMIKYVSKEVVKNDSRSAIGNNGDNITLSVGTNSVKLDKEKFTINNKEILNETMSITDSDFEQIGIKEK